MVHIVDTADSTFCVQVVLHYLTSITTLPTDGFFATTICKNADIRFFMCPSVRNFKTVCEIRQ
jgi:hypothetical protein